MSAGNRKQETYWDTLKRVEEEGLRLYVVLGPVQWTSSHSAGVLPV